MKNTNKLVKSSTHLLKLPIIDRAINIHISKQICLLSSINHTKQSIFTVSTLILGVKGGSSPPTCLRTMEEYRRKEAKEKEMRKKMGC